ncbi:TPA: phage tail protein [Citrobacter freundii]|uniref:phage tail-collar fiber domain-containing protein n=1 Tax=Citrobacter TaxID=544 RepID=UPI0006586308|nr:MULTISPECIES: phage tail protein [Citrobacter]DAO21197.1 MAG TPA: Tail fiber protein [Caudoviricetes sp.]EJO6490945.1 phage tail protein [Citrobacter freundii]EKT8684761.1 phage tail protein [Citrobacter freundii]EKV6333956.1 phage tail protein [Citrobacter freundii]ELH0169651.1 phage tail protein [Citrobacter freundii]
MSQTVITTAFEQLKAQQAASGAAVVLDSFIFANVPNLDITSPIDPAEAIPPAAQIVHRADVTLTGVVNENAVVYSVTLGTAVGDFDFNWVGLVNKASNTLAMIVHAPVQHKVANASGVQGNVLTRSFLMEYVGAKKETQITIPAATWQIDFTARLAGMDERVRLENVDIYGQGAFLGDGFLVKRSGNNYSVTAGVGYVAGLRVSITADQALTVTTKPTKVWVDACFTGTLTSVWQVRTSATVADTLSDYVKNDVSHYVFAVAEINADGTVTDLRPKGSLSQQQASDDYLRKENNLADISDKSQVRKNISLDRFVQTGGNPNMRLILDDTSWYVYDNILKENVALALNMGGTGATDATGARTNLGLGNSATKDTGTTAGTVAAGDDSRITGALQKTGGDVTGVLRRKGLYPNILLTDDSLDDNTVGKTVGIEQNKGNLYIYFRRGDGSSNADQIHIVFPSVGGTIITTGNLPTPGDINAYTKAECDAKYQRQTRLGQESRYGSNESYIAVPTGCVMTGLDVGGGSSSETYIGYRPLQVNINGSWATINQL